VVTNLDGERALLAAAGTDWGWRIFVNAPSTLAEVPLVRTIERLALLGTVALVVAAFVAHVLARRIEQPLKATLAAAEALRGGREVAPVSSSIQEINTVTDAMAHAGAELAARENRQRLLTAELNHRVRNMLTIVTAMVRRTLTREQPIDQAREVLLQRVAALGHANELVTASERNGAQLQTVLQTVLKPFSARAHLNGSEVTLTPKATQSLMLAFHELATNASKYGALSRSEGRINVEWRVVTNTGTDRLLLRWHELGGPPASAPLKRGFGTTLLEAIFEHDLGGKPHLAFTPDGFVCEVDLPLSAVGAQSEPPPLRSPPSMTGGEDNIVPPILQSL
jgi:two-component sensor histidine kinase